MTLPVLRFSVIAGAAIAALAAVGCTGPGVRPAHVSPARREVLTRDEIMSSPTQRGDLYQAIRSLRPNFLMRDPGVHSNGSTASLPLAVYIGHVRQGGLDALQSLSALSVEEVRYYDPVASQNAFGPTASGGALVITLYDPSKQPDPVVPKPPGAR